MKGGGRMMSSKTSISSSPWLMLPPSSEAYKFYSLGDSKVVSINKERPRCRGHKAGLNMWDRPTAGWHHTTWTTDSLSSPIPSPAVT